MKKNYKKFTAPILWFLLILGIAGYCWADITGVHHKILRRSLALIIAVGPSALYSLTGRRVAGLLRFSIATALMVYFIVSGKIDIEAMYNCLDKWQWLLLGATLIFTQPLAGFIRWKWLLDVQGIDITYGKSFRLTMVAFFFNTCLPGATGGDLFKAFAISKADEKTAEAVTTIILDRLTGLAALLVMCAAAFILNLKFIIENPEFKQIGYFLVIAIIVGLIFFIMVFSTSVMNFLRILPAARWNFPGRTSIVKAYKALHSYKGSKKVLLFTITVSFLSHIATVLGAMSFATALGLDSLTFKNYILLIPLGLAFNSIPITPGGVGQGQAAFDYLFRNALPGLTGAGALGAAMMTFIHIAIIFISMTGGLFYGLGYHQMHEAVEKAEKKIHDDEEEQEESVEES